MGGGAKPARVGEPKAFFGIKAWPPALAGARLAGENQKPPMLYDFVGLIEAFFPKELRGQFREIHSELTKVPDTNREGLYMAAINSMSAKETKRLVDMVIVLREDVARAYYKRSFSR